MKNSVHNVNFHVVWTTKYRKKFMRFKIKNTVEESLILKSTDLDIKIEKYEIMPEHIHLFIRMKPNQSIAYIVSQLKGYTSYYTRKKLNLYKYKSLWSSGYFCESIGQISESIILKYIENQWRHYN